MSRVGSRGEGRGDGGEGEEAAAASGLAVGGPARRRHLSTRRRSHSAPRRVDIFGAVELKNPKEEGPIFCKFVDLPNDATMFHYSVAEIRSRLRPPPSVQFLLRCRKPELWTSGQLRLFKSHRVSESPLHKKHSVFLMDDFAGRPCGAGETQARTSNFKKTLTSSVDEKLKRRVQI